MATPTLSTASSTSSWTITAAVFPRKMPAGSRPESRSESRVPSATSREKLRWVASTHESSTAIQNSPAAAGASTDRSGPSARPKSKMTAAAKGTTWLSATRERSSMRRSFPATRRASCHMGRLPHAPSPGEVDDTIRQRDRALVLVRAEQDRAATSSGVEHQAVKEVARLLVEAGMRLVEQPQLRVARNEDGKRRAPPLPGREPAHLRRPEPGGSRDRRRRLYPGRPERVAQVLLDGELVVEEAMVPKEPDPPAHRPPVPCKVVPEDDRLARVERNKAGAQPEQARLAGAVRPSDERDLPRRDLERDSCEEGEAAGEGNGLT